MLTATLAITLIAALSVWLAGGIPLRAAGLVTATTGPIVAAR